MKMYIKTHEIKKKDTNFYRHDIEILRGFSILIVLLYHFDFNLFKSNFISAGYIGVDIFFIISGYIITRIILEQKKFSIKEFYIKRIKRLFPVLFLVLIISISIGYFLLDLYLLKKNVNSTYLVLTGLSNYFFWLTSTIYQFADRNNMLFLHTWSLAIEFQFYLFFPILVIFLSKNKLRVFLIFIFFLSYLSIFLFYEKHNMFNFYSPSSRIFEISAGCLAFLFEKNIKQKIKKEFEINFYITGFLLIFLYMLFFNSEDFHPNPSSIIFVIGACMILIFYNNNLEILYKLQLNKIGKISYSLYLWHFPIIVFSNYFIDNVNDYSKFLVFLFCLILSIISYLSVESKFRKAEFKKNLIFIFFIFLLILTITLKVNNRSYEKNTYIFDNYFLAEESNKFLQNQNFFSFRKNKNIYSFKNDYKKYSPSFSNLNNKKILFLGDSHSKDIFNMFFTHKNYYNNYEFSRYGINLVDFKNKRLKNLINSELFKKSNLIIFSQRYKDEDIEYIEELIRIANKYDKKLILTLKKPEFLENDKLNKTFLDIYVLNKKNFKKSDLDEFAFKNLKKENFIEINQKIENKYFKKIKLVNFYSIICSETKKTCEIIDNKQSKNFYDYGHFTLAGSKYFGSKIIETKFYKKLFN